MVALMSSKAVRWVGVAAVRVATVRISHYTGIAAESCPSLRDKAITAHVLRHTTVITPAVVARADVPHFSLSVWPPTCGGQDFGARGV